MANSDVKETLKEVIRTFPHYLSEQEKLSLFSELCNTSFNIDYYSESYTEDECLQGDVYIRFKVFDYKNNLVRDNVRGMVLSNTCDLSSENRRMIGPNVVFCVVLKESQYTSFLKKNNLSSNQIYGHIKDVHEQRVTNRMYFPKRINSDSYIALLDEVYTMPLNLFWQQNDRRRIFRLSNAGFYIFLMKLTLNFCRMSESIHRTPLSYFQSVENQEGK